tara:strand:+ start:788 stop:940 length:153 start_codon:yes stop_codon:yes gene_type:complete
VALPKLKGKKNASLENPSMALGKSVKHDVLPVLIDASADGSRLAACRLRL